MRTDVLDAVETDLRNSAVVLDADQQLRDRLRTAARLGSKVNEELVFLRMQVARYTNDFTEKGAALLGLTE